MAVWFQSGFFVQTDDKIALAGPPAHHANSMFLRMAHGRTGRRTGCEYRHAPVTPTRGGPTCRVASLPSTSDLCNSRACAGQFRIGTFRACFENPEPIRKRNFSSQLPQLVRPCKYKHTGMMPSPVDETRAHIRTSGWLRRLAAAYAVAGMPEHTAPGTPGRNRSTRRGGFG